MFKITLPNPWEMSIPEFFAQMRIVLKAAEKSYQEIVKGKEESSEAPFISFVQKRLYDEVKEAGTDLDNFSEEAQEIELEITAN